VICCWLNWLNSLNCCIPSSVPDYQRAFLTLLEGKGIVRQGCDKDFAIYRRGKNKVYLSFKDDEAFVITLDMMTKYSLSISHPDSPELIAAAIDRTLTTTQHLATILATKENRPWANGINQIRNSLRKLRRF
jgi:hypothetical protein